MPTTLEAPCFPLFRQRFLVASCSELSCGKRQPSSSTSLAARAAGAGEADMDLGAPGSLLPPPVTAAPAGPSLQRPANLRTLDLRALPRDDGPPSETQLRRAKFQFFDKHCSQVAEGLFVSGDTVARNREQLRAHGITHVMNCVGFVCKEHFRGELDYRTYFLQDTPAEDILCVLYDAFDFIEDALRQNGKVLVHCSQGVSRSVTVVIGYLMWRTGQSYDQVYSLVKAVRGVANPNIGFTCQLLQWQKRRRAPPTRSRLYRMAPHCPHAPLFLVPRPVPPPHEYETHTWRQLDPRAAFIVQNGPRMWVWVGSQCTAAMAEAAQVAARRLVKYEATGTNHVEVCRQGREPQELLVLLDPAPLGPEAARDNARRASITGEMSLALPTSANSLPRDDAAEMDPFPIVAVPVPDPPKSLASASGRVPPPLLQSVPSPAMGLALVESPGSTATPSSAHPASPFTPFAQHDAGPAAQSPSPELKGPSALDPPPEAQSGGGGGRAGAGPGLPAHPQWNVAPVEEYHADWQLYMDAVRGPPPAEPGSDAALALCVGGAGVRAGERARVSVTGAERANPGLGMSGVFGFEEAPQVEYDGGFDGSSTPRGGLPLLQRPDSPGASEGRLKKYRRGMTLDWINTGGPPTEKPFLSGSMLGAALSRSLGDGDLE